MELLRFATVEGQEQGKGEEKEQVKKSIFVEKHEDMYTVLKKQIVYAQI